MLFSVSVFMESISDTRQTDDVIWEESIIIVDAESEDAAQAYGESFGRQAECRYETATGDFLTWRFVKIESAQMIDAEQVKHGTEVFSRFMTAAEARSLLTPFD